MPYATRPMHDADSHIMEPADWLHPYLDAPTRARFPLVWTERCMARRRMMTHTDAIERALRDLALAAVFGLATGLLVVFALGWRG